MGRAQIKEKQWKLSKRAFTVLSYLWVLFGDDFCQNGNDFFYPAKLVEVRNITPRVPMAWPTRTAKRWAHSCILKSSGPNFLDGSALSVGPTLTTSLRPYELEEVTIISFETANVRCAFASLYFGKTV